MDSAAGTGMARRLVVSPCVYCSTKDCFMNSKADLVVLIVRTGALLRY